MAAQKRTTIGLWILVGVLLVALILLFQNPGTRADSQEITYSQFLREVPRTRDVTIRGDTLTGHFTDNRTFFVGIPHDPAIATRLAEKSIAVTIGTPAPEQSWQVTLLVNGLPLIGYFALMTWPLLRIARALEALAAPRTARAKES